MASSSIPRKRGKMGTLTHRFYKNVGIGHFDNEQDACVLWTGSTDGHGYGQMWDSKLKRPEKAHRISWRLFRGEIPRGRGVFHKCDTPLCINPLHLFLGSQRDNMEDAYNKGRHVAHVWAAKTHCPDGHEYTKANTAYWGKSKSRFCRQCDLDRKKRS